MELYSKERKEYTDLRNKIAKELHEHLPDIDIWKINVIKYYLFDLIRNEGFNINEESTVYFRSINLKCGNCGEKIKIEGKKYDSDLTVLCGNCNEELLDIK